MAIRSNNVNYATPSYSSIAEENFADNAKYFSLHDNVLDGTYRLLGSTTPLWSKDLSDATGAFQSPIVITDNLFNFPIWKYQLGAYHGTISNATDTGFTMSSTATDCYTATYDSLSKWGLAVTPSTTYKISFNKQNNTVGNTYIFYYANPTSLVIITSSASTLTSFDFTTPANCTYLQIRFGITASGLSEVFSDIKITKGNYPVHALQVKGDAAANVYPTNFVYTLYNGAAIVFQQSYTNGSVAWLQKLSQTYTATCYTLSISKINKPNYTLRLTNLYNPHYITRSATNTVRANAVSKVSLELKKYISGNVAVRANALSNLKATVHGTTNLKVIAGKSSIVDTKTGTSVQSTLSEESKANIVSISSASAQTVTTLGKNLLDYRLAPSNLYDFEFITNDDTGGVKTWTIKCKPLTTYTVSKSNTSSRFRAFTTDVFPVAGMYSTGYVDVDDTSSTLTITTSDVANYLSVYMYNAGFGDVAPTWVQIEQGAVATAYTAFVPNSPSIDYPAPITNVTNFDIISSIAGTNIFLNSRLSSNANWMGTNGSTTKVVAYAPNGQSPNANASCLENKSVQVNAYIAQGLDLKLNTRYTLSVWVYIPSGNTGYYNPVVFYDNAGWKGLGSGSWITQRDTWVKTSFTFTTHATYATTIVGFGTNGSTAGNTFYICNPKLELGDAATQWTPAPADIAYNTLVDGVYKTNVAYEFGSLPEGDKNTIERGADGKTKSVKNIAKDTLRGLHTFAWFDNAKVGGATRSFTLLLPINGKISAGANMLCDKFKTARTTSGAVSIDQNGYIYFYDIPNTLFGISSADDLNTSKSKINAWLAINPVTIYYPLATPVITIIPDVSLATYKSLTNIATSSIQQVTFTAEFLKDIRAKITNKAVIAKQEVVKQASNTYVSNRFNRSSNLVVKSQGVLHTTNKMTKPAALFVQNAASSKPTIKVPSVDSLCILPLKGQVIDRQEGTYVTSDIAEAATVEITYMSADSTQIVTTQGKNLFPKYTSTRSQNGITLTAGEDGTITLNGTSTAIAFLALYSVSTPTALNGTYTLSVNNPATADIRVRINKTYDGISDVLEDVWCASVNAKKTVSFSNAIAVNYVVRVASGVTLNNYVIKPQLELGAVATPYTPFIPNSPSPSYPAPIIIPNNFTITASNSKETNSVDVSYALGDIPNGVKNTIERKSDGKTYYIKRVGTAVFDGSADEPWSDGTTVKVGVYRKFTTIPGMKPEKSFNDISNIRCSHFKAISAGSTYSNVQGVGVTTSPILYMYHEQYNTNTDMVAFRAALAASPVTVQYALAVPEYIPIPTVSLKSYLGVTNISTDATPSVTFVAEFLNGVNGIVPTLTNVHTRMKDATRRVYGKVLVSYMNPLQDINFINSANSTAYNTGVDQVLDGFKDASDNFFMLYNNKLDGNSKLLGANSKIGWFSQSLSKSDGTFDVDPTVTLTFSPRMLRSLAICSSALNDIVLVDYTVNVLSNGTTITYNISGNNVYEVYVSEEPLPEVTQIDIVIHKVSKANTPANITEVTVSSNVWYNQEDLINIDFLEELSYADEIEALGGVSANEVSISIRNDNKQFYFNNEKAIIAKQLKKNRRIVSYLGTEVVPGEIEWYKLGTFWSYSWDVPVDELYAKVKAFDTLGLLNTFMYTNRQVLVNTSLGGAIDTVLTDAKTRHYTDLTWSVDPALYSIQMPFVWFEDCTYMQALNKLAQSYRINIYCNREGTILAALRATSDLAYDMWSDSTNVISKSYPTLYTEVPNTIRVYVSKVTVAVDNVINYSTPFVLNSSTTLSLVASAPIVSGVVVTVDADPTVLYTYTSYSWGIEITLTGAGNVRSISASANALTVTQDTCITVVNNQSVQYNGVLSKEIKSDFIQSVANATQLADIILADANTDIYDADVNYSGDISLTINDPIILKDNITPVDKYRIKRHTLYWDGALTGTAKLNT